MKYKQSYTDWFMQAHPDIYTNPSLYWQSKTNPELIKKYRDEYDANLTKGQDIWHQLLGGKISPLDAQGQLTSAGISLDADETQYLNNSLAQFASDDAQEKTKELQDRQYLSGASQLGELGLNPATIASAGSVGLGSAHSADFSKANLAQERSLNEFNQKAQTTRTILSLVSGLAAAGIHGGAMFAAKNAAAKIAASTAHSASTIRYSFDRYGNQRGYTITDKQYQ